MKINIILLVLMVLAATGCKQELASLEYGSPSAKKKVLIAGESSAFKQQVLSGTIDILGKSDHHFKLIGFNDLGTEALTSYNAVVIFNSLMVGKPDGRMESFLKEHQDDSRIIVFTTTGTAEYEDWRPSYNVDAITAASQESTIENSAKKLATLIRSRL